MCRARGGALSAAGDPDAAAPVSEGASLHDRLQAFVGTGQTEPAYARDPVNLPMIRHLTDALGDRNPVYVDEAFAAKSVHGGIVAPATALQVWTMRGLAPPEPAGGGDGDTPPPGPMELLNGAGYTSVVATNCEQEYARYVRPGDLLSVTSVVESITGPKATGLGEGYFLTTLHTYRDQHDEVVGTMRFRLLKFKPPEKKPDAKAATAPPPPPRDTAFWWEGAAAGELRIQRCTQCQRLRHTPRPMCPQCQSLDWDFVVASGRGEVYSWVLHHHPPIPGRDMPLAIGVIQLEEGTRVVGNIVEVDPADIHAGMPVEVVFVEDSNGRTLPQWRPR